MWSLWIALQRRRLARHEMEPTNSSSSGGSLTAATIDVFSLLFFFFFLFVFGGYRYLSGFLLLANNNAGDPSRMWHSLSQPLLAHTGTAV